MGSSGTSNVIMLSGDTHSPCHKMIIIWLTIGSMPSHYNTMHIYLLSKLFWRQVYFYPHNGKSICWKSLKVSICKRNESLTWMTCAFLDSFALIFRMVIKESESIQEISFFFERIIIPQYFATWLEQSLRSVNIAEIFGTYEF